MRKLYQNLSILINHIKVSRLWLNGVCKFTGLTGGLILGTGCIGSLANVPFAVPYSLVGLAFFAISPALYIHWDNYIKEHALLSTHKANKKV